MKLQDLFEEENPSLLALIKTKCSSFLSESGKKGLLYRGASNPGTFMGLYQTSDGNSAQVYSKTARKDRKPLNTNVEISNVLDDWFEKNIGFRARSQAVFAFPEGNKRFAEEYGGAHCVIFPIGNFSYAWSPLVTDLYEVAFGALGNSKGLNAEFKLEDGSPNLEAIDVFMKKLKYTNKQLPRALKSKREIMLNCNEFIAVRYYTNKQLGEIHEALGLTFTD